MEPLPEIDDLGRLVAASPDRTWRELVAVLAGSGRPLPGALVRAWGFDPPGRRGDWPHPVPGDTIPGFVVAEADAPRLLTLRGRHRFARYELRFALRPAGVDRAELQVRTSATFPGLLGRTYRAFVIGSGAHVLVMRGLLARVARRAEREAVRPAS